MGLAVPVPTAVHGRVVLVLTGAYGGTRQGGRYSSTGIGFELNQAGTVLRICYAMSSLRYNGISALVLTWAVLNPGRQYWVQCVVLTWAVLNPGRQY
eukprot:3057401-Rhodomonas_salina.1